ncbi:MAG: ankyrin repeat domain-containing protein [Gammaproteobacteria bacterium]|nr:ankyrin repeat domain-containing protein [Gammaproteobacteria bacterium]
MKRLIILLAMVAVSAGALHSYQQRNLYIQAALLSEAYTLVAPVKRQVSDHYIRNGVMPHDNAGAGISPASSIFGTSVTRVSVNRGGAILVDFDEEIGKQAMLFSPTINSGSGLLNWRCSSDSIAIEVLEKLKPSCTHLPSSVESKLMHAIANRSVANVESLLAKGADTDVVVNGNTPLMLAAKIGDLAIVNALLRAGAAVDNKGVNAERRTPLMVAISSDNADIAAELLSRGASVERKDYRGLTAYDYAEETDRRLTGERYTLMVAARLNPMFAGRQHPFEFKNNAPKIADLKVLYVQLRTAAQDCNAYRLTSLLKAQDDLGGSLKVGGKLLSDHLAKPACSEQLLEFLSTRKSYQRALNARFANAMQTCNSHQVEQALNENPNIDVFRFVRDKSHFNRAVTAGCSNIIALITRKLDIKEQLADDTLAMAIRHAPQSAIIEIVGLLIDAGAKINTVDVNGETPLSLAIAMEQPVVAKFILDAGADVNQSTANASYPIIEASKKGMDHLVDQMLKLGANVDQQDLLGRTALLAAVARGQDRLVGTLLKQGADALLEDRNGISAITLAESKNLSKIHRLLTASNS